jgi:hypothetical protein
MSEASREDIVLIIGDTEDTELNEWMEEGIVSVLVSAVGSEREKGA